VWKLWKTRQCCARTECLKAKAFELFRGGC
jgi:hypothetical protein